MPQSSKEAWPRVRYIDNQGSHASKPWKRREPTVEGFVLALGRSGAIDHCCRNFEKCFVVDYRCQNALRSSRCFHHNSMLVCNSEHCGWKRSSDSVCKMWYLEGENGGRELRQCVATKALGQDQRVQMLGRESLGANYAR
jgi:hypothetical protein